LASAVSEMIAALAAFGHEMADHRSMAARRAL
jgi:hypothetical protein